MPINLNSLAGPTSASIFQGSQLKDKVKGKVLRRIVAVVIDNIALSLPGRVRLDLTNSVDLSRPMLAARSPIERVIADNLRTEMESISISGSISATPLGVIAAQSGAIGSYTRRDLRELRKLYQMQDTREPVTLIWGDRVWESVAMSIASKHVGLNKVDLSLRFEEIRIVSPLSVSAALDLDETFIGAGSTSELGSQPTQLVPEPAGVGGGLGG